MKKLLSFILLLSAVITNAQVGIGTTNPDPSAILEISSTTGGTLFSRMTQAQRDAIVAPATGLLIYQTNNATGFYYYDGTVWTPFGGGDTDWTVAGNDMYNANTGNVGVGTNTPARKLHVEEAGAATVLLNQDFEGGFAPMTTGGSANWATQVTTVNGGTNASGSGNIADGQTSFMEYNVTVPAGGATLSFYYSVSSEAGFDYLRFYIDGVQQTQWSGTINYTQQTYALTAGAHTLRWAYEKDGSTSSGNDAAYIDDIVITSAAPAAVRIIDGNQGAGKVLMSDANGDATWQQLTNSSISDIPTLASFQGMIIPICNNVTAGSTGNFTVDIKGVTTTVNYEVLGRETTAGKVVNISGSDVLLAPHVPERLQVRYDFTPALPFNPRSIIFTANNSSSFPDTFSLNYAAKSVNSITVNITRTDRFGDQSSACWQGQFYFDVLMTD